MRVLLVENRPGRHGAIAAQLRDRGHRVVAVVGVDPALTALKSEHFDAVVTDWALGSDDASVLVNRAHGPCIVLAGATEQVVDHPAIAVVLTEPCSPNRVVAALSDAVARVEASASTAIDDVGLPIDTRDRLRLVLALLDDPGAARIHDDGLQVTIEGTIRDPERCIGILEGIGGDLRVLAEGGGETPLRLLLRLDRAGRPFGVDVAIAPDAPWPSEDPFAIDFHASSLTPDRFLELCDRMHRARRDGREPYPINLPSHLRLCLEAIGRLDDLPIRRPSGPRLPEVLHERWR